MPEIDGVSFAFLALAFAKQLFQPLVQVMQAGMKIGKHLDEFSSLVQQMAGGCVLQHGAGLERRAQTFAAQVARAGQ